MYPFFSWYIYYSFHRAARVVFLLGFAKKFGDKEQTDNGCTSVS